MKYALLYLACTAAMAQSPNNAAVTVDFAKPVTGTISEAGFVAGIDSSSPPFSMAGPLKANLWTVSGLFPFNDPAPPAESYARASQFTSRLLMTVSDLWGYPNSTATPPPSEFPYQDWPRWQALVQQAAQASASRNLMWGVWNEPDSIASWPGTQQQYFDTYGYAYPILRQVLGAGAMIGGPQISSYDKNYLTAFLNYAVANNLQVNFLAWHEIPSADTGIASIASDLEDARTSFLQNPAYASLHIQKIFIDRSVGAVSNHMPGDVLGYLYYLEQGQADGAGKDCWPDSYQASECFNDTVDGVLTTQFQPRGVWWAYKTYGDGVATRVASTTTDYRVVALASSSGVSAQTAQVLVGYFNTAGAATGVPITVNLNNLGALPFLQGATQALVTVELIPAAGEAAIAQLTPVSDGLVPIQAGSAQATIAFARPGEAYRITIVAPANGAAPAPAYIVNAASFVNQGVAPGSLVTIFGSNLSTQTGQPLGFPLPTTLDGVTVTANDIALPLLYVSPTQINAQLPYSAATGNATLVVRSGANVSAPLAFTVIPASPGIFLGANGYAVAQNQDGSLNSSHAAPVGSVLTVYMTGQGAVDNPVPDGVAAPAAVFSRATLPASATINGVPAMFQFLGLAPGFAGLLQANIVVPNTGGGQAQLIVTIGGVESNPAFVSIN